MNCLFEKTKSFLCRNSQSIQKYTRYAIFSYVLYAYPIVFLSVALSLLVFNRIEAEIKFNTDNRITFPRFDFEMIEINKEQVVKEELKDEPIIEEPVVEQVTKDPIVERVILEEYKPFIKQKTIIEEESDDPMSKSVIFEDNESEEITSNNKKYKTLFK